MTQTDNLIKVFKREPGKTAVKAVRNSGMIPGVFYMKTGKSIPFSVVSNSVNHIVYTSETKIFNLQIEGETEIHECILKDVQLDPVTDDIIHLDFYGIVRGQKLTTEIPIILKGTAKGIREGGLLQQTLRHIHISCLPKHLPKAIELDISNLGIGDSLHIKDLQLENIEFLTPKDTTIVSVITPRVTQEAEVTKETAESKEEKEETKE